MDELNTRMWMWMSPGLVGLLFVTGTASWAEARASNQMDGESVIFTKPVLPVEGEQAVITFRKPLATNVNDAQMVRFRIVDPKGKIVLERQARLGRGNGKAGAQITWEATHNGLYRVVAAMDSIPGSGERSLLLPVQAKGRALDFVWFGYRPFLRWATVITSATDEQAPVLRERGIKALRWAWGSNHPVVKEKPINQLAAEAERFYRVPDGFAFDGYGIDEFGEYPQTEAEQRSLEWLRGLIKARRQFPKDFTVAAWQAGGVRDEWLGLYKQAADLLLLQAYVLYYVPKALSTENIYEDLRGRMQPVRGADMFTRVYGFPCKTLLAVDIVGDKGKRLFDVGELEQVVRFVRREFPEMRGLAFFNSGADEAAERIADQLCFDYFIKPVLTFQPNGLWLDRLEGRSQLVAALSNIGGMDSGAVTVRFRVNGKVVGTKHVESVPAGDSRLTNRALIRCDWKPKRTGTFEMLAQIVSAADSTVLDAEII